MNMFLDCPCQNRQDLPFSAIFQLQIPQGLHPFRNCPQTLRTYQKCERLQEVAACAVATLGDHCECFSNSERNRD